MSGPPDWDERFAEPGYAYGTEPNDFLREVAERIPRGPVLCLGEGEGRNAAFLAGLGFAVTALDTSRVGLAKAEALARERGVRVTTVPAPGGAFVLEAYTPRQLEFGTGGPRDEVRLVTLAALRVELAGLDLEIGRELDREIHEGRYHEGRGAGVQVLGRKR